MKIKYANKEYDVIDTRSMPGRKTMYAIEDEPGHIDWLINVEVIEERLHPIDELTRGLSDFEQTLFNKIFVNTSTKELEVERLYELVKLIAPDILEAAKNQLQILNKTNETNYDTRSIRFI